MKPLYLGLFPFLLFFSCSEQSDSIQSNNEEKETVQLDTLTSGDEITLINMSPEPFYEDPQGDNILMENIKYLQGELNGEKVELILFLDNYQDFGLMMSTERPENQWRLKGDYFAESDSFSLKLSFQDSISQLFASKKEGVYYGTQISSSDTVPVALKEFTADAPTTQFFIDHASQMNLHFSKEGVFIERPNYGTYFNSSMSLWSNGEGTDTGEMRTDYHTAVFRKDSTLVLVSGEVYCDMGAIYKDGHGYESDDPISIGEEYYSSVDIDVSVIKNGVAVEHSIQFEDDFYQRLYTFENYLLFLNEKTNESKVFEWDFENEKYQLMGE